MYKRIVVPLDGSEIAEYPIPYVTGLAAASKANVALVHVCGPQEGEAGRMHEVYINYIADGVRKDLKGMGTTECGVTATVRFGDPTQEILGYVGEQSNTLLAITSHGRSDIEHWLMGGVAYKVLHHSPVPIRLLRVVSAKNVAKRSWPEKRILVLLDGSEFSQQALPYAQAHAKLAHAEITLLRVCEPAVVRADYPASLGSWEEHVERLTREKEEERGEYLTNVSERLVDAGLKVQTQVLLGDAVTEIAHYLENESFDLVAMTTHGRSGIGRWVLGSVTERLAQSCHLPLLLIRAHKPHSVE